MNEIEKAVDFLEDCKSIPGATDDYEIALLTLAKECARKQIPTPPTAPKQGYRRCPSCNAGFIEELGTTNYCGNCGQALKWEDD